MGGLPRRASERSCSGNRHPRLFWAILRYVWKSRDWLVATIQSVT